MERRISTVELKFTLREIQNGLNIVEESEDQIETFCSNKACKALNFYMYMW